MILLAISEVRIDRLQPVVRLGLFHLFGVCVTLRDNAILRQILSCSREFGFVVKVKDMLLLVGLTACIRVPTLSFKKEVCFITFIG